MEITKSKKIMWTEIEIILNDDFKNKIEIENDIEECFNIFSSFEKEFSRFDDNSDLSKLNKNRILEVSDNFVKVLKISREVYKITDWYFNPLINISSIWYDKSFEKIPLSQDFLQGNKGENNNFNFVEIEIIWNKVIMQENQNLDLWWIVKWFSVDIVKDFLKQKWYKDFIINAWGDIFVWEVKSTIAINSPFNKKEIFALLDLQNCSISTSWIYKRKWKINWKNFHHILNPKNLENNNEIISISIIWKNCYLTDSLATACIAMWFNKAKDFLKKQNLEAIIILENRDYFLVWDLNKYNFEKI